MAGGVAERVIPGVMNPGDHLILKNNGSDNNSEIITTFAL